MNSENMKFVVFVALVFCLFGYFEYRKRNKPCEKCGGKREVVGVKDPFGKNISKTVTIGFNFGFTHKKSIKLKCKSCDQIFNEKWK